MQLTNIKFKNNTQRVAYRLLTADGHWLSKAQIAGSFKNRIPSVDSRIRDLRRSKFGKFKVDCRSAACLGKKCVRQDLYYYRIDPETVSDRQIKRVFK